jgi:hypothetical protein
MTIKTTLVLATTLIGFLSLANADSVKVLTTADVAGQTVTTEKEIGFTPTTDTITVKVAGKTCTMGSSTLGSAPQGCNYIVNVDVNGVSATLKEDSTIAVCSKIPATCE